MTSASTKDRPSRGFPKILGVRWFNVAVLAAAPALWIFGVFFVPLTRKTLVFSCAYYLFSMFGITAGFHRLWAHRSYNATLPLRVFLILGGTSAVQGSCYWWGRGHRSHHRWTDTDSDPYDSSRGLLWTHVGWLLFKTTLRTGHSEASDLAKDPLVMWNHRNYFSLVALFGLVVPAVIPALWGDFWGGLCYSASARLAVAHHCTFAINSIAHYLGETPYDDELSPRDHVLSAILTMGEGYHNFHHQFPTDYRNAIGFWQYDPTKWFIATCKMLGLASNLRAFPSNEISKGALTMKLKDAKQLQDAIRWPPTRETLPVLSWAEVHEAATKKPLIVVSGFVHDVSGFINEHPGGPALLTSNSGKDMSAAFFGGVYKHSNAAHNMMSMMRVAVVVEAGELSDDRTIPPSQRLFVAARSCNAAGR
uniref:Acyl-CoA desaturase n=1 Tax=Mycena chlorophos TaxID=658473 RepID=A0ABQ0M6G4_MYCCL|nr:delta-9 fatty acid desaturase protein [Mycena chlorophos]